jgi:hypothetical protein
MMVFHLIALWRTALALYEEDALTGDSFDQVYCVFDRDRHTTFDAAVQRTKDLSAAGKPLLAITSTPCFEVWLLLHFCYSDQPFHPIGRKSVGDQVPAVCPVVAMRSAHLRKAASA